DIGGNADLVSPIALLIAPINVGLTPTMALNDVSKRIKRVERLLACVPDVESIVQTVPSNVSFGLVADRSAEPARRIDGLHDLADRIGTAYAPMCLSTCGNAFF